jgi:hypothetical protein
LKLFGFPDWLRFVFCQTRHAPLVSPICPPIGRDPFRARCASPEIVGLFALALFCQTAGIARPNGSLSSIATRFVTVVLPATVAEMIRSRART